MSRRLLSYAAALSAVVVVVVAVVAIMMSERRGGNQPVDAFARLEQSEDLESPDERPQVEILNGCGVSGIAAQTHEYLRGVGFDVVNVENARAFDYLETVVIDRGGDVRIARRVARILGTDNVIRQVRPDLMLQVTVILGSDYRGLSPFREVSP